MTRFIRRGLPILGIASLLFVVATVQADDWSVTTANFRRHAVILKQVGPDGAHVAESTDSAGRIIPLDQFVSAAHPVNPMSSLPVPKFTLALTGGDRLVGNMTSVNGESLMWESPTLGSIPVPLDHLVALGRGRDVTVPDKSPDQDVITLVNGDSVTGVFSDLADGKVKITVNNQNSDVPLADVARIAFANSAGAGAVAGKYRVRFTDRSVLTVADLSMADDKFTLTIAGKPPKVVIVPAKLVLGFEQLNGPVQWLSSLVPAESVQTPFLKDAPAYPARFGSAVDGSPMSFNGQTTDHGIGVHAYSKLTFNIDPRWKYFRTQFAIDSRRDNPRNLADVTVRIKLDDKVAFEKAHVVVGAPDPATVIELGDARTITLECDFGPVAVTQNCLDWIDPAFTLVKPLPPVEPTTVPAATKPATMPATEPTTLPTTEPTATTLPVETQPV
jgi:hypothetical protein